MATSNRALAAAPQKRNLTRVPNRADAAPKREIRLPEQVQSLQRVAGNRAVCELLCPPNGTSAPSSVMETVAREGMPLDSSLRALMEHRLGADLAAVRLHTDGLAADSARAIGAKAYAAGHHVVFGPGRFAPETLEGRRLLAHELTHVVQQRAGTFPATPSSLASLSLSPAGSLAEREAGRVSSATSPGPVTQSVPAGAVMRQAEGERESNGVLDTVLGGLIGDFNEDPTLAEIGINTGVGLIPGVGEVTASRDVTANVYYMAKKEEYTSPGRWIGLVFALVSLFPELGAALKGLGRAVLKGAAEAVGPIVRLMERVLEKLGHSEGIRNFFLKNWGKIVGEGTALFEKVMGKLSSVLTRAVTFISSKAEAFARALERIRQAAVKALPEAFEKAKRLIDRVLGRLTGREERTAAKTIEAEAEKAGASTAAKEAETGAAGGAGSKGTSQGSAKPGPGQALVGSSRSQMRRAARKIISDDPDHPLRFLLGDSGKFKLQKGLTHAELIDRPDLVQMGHIASNKLAGQERLMLQGAWENQLLSQTVEQSHIGGAVLEQEAIEIGGIAVEKQTAIFWEKIGWLKSGTVAKAPKVL
jgi:hypothetical protein